MSRIGKLPIMVPKDVNIKRNQNKIEIIGPQGNLMLKIPKEININFNNNKLIIEKMEETTNAAEKYGLIRSLLNNMIIGVSKKFEKKLLLIGVGYKAHLSEKNLILYVGFSKLTTILIPDDIEIIIETNTNILIKGCNKENVGIFASLIRAIRPPEPYNGRGICYNDEIIRRKKGKSGK